MTKSDLFIRSGAAWNPCYGADFRQKGWLGPISLLSSRGVEELTALLGRSTADFAQPGELARMSDVREFGSRPWFKSMHVVDATFRSVAMNPVLLGLVAGLLGPRFVLWGCSLVQRAPGQRHRWHVDVEHLQGKGLTVFVGLEGANASSSLTVLEQSHRLTAVPQSIGLDSDGAILEFSRKHGLDAGLRVLPIEPGSMCVMDGRLWHRSENASTLPRVAALIQYSTPDADIRVPRSWGPEISWLSGRPPVIQVDALSEGIGARGLAGP